MKQWICICLVFLFSGVAMGDTEISEEPFRVVLPGEWSLAERSEEEGLWAYQSASGDERLTISVKYFRTEPSQKQMQDAIESYVGIRRNESSALNPSISATSNDFKNYPTAIANTFIEKGPADRKAANKTIVSKVGIANFYYESYEGSEIFLSKMKAILATTGFAS